jgi:acetyl-CoA carboxylase/biotin carboxylase 1
MLAKGVIKEIVEWKNARRFFYWRLRRRLIEQKVADLSGDNKLEEVLGKCSGFYSCMTDQAFVNWAEKGEKSIMAALDSRKKENARRKLEDIIREFPDILGFH